MKHKNQYIVICQSVVGNDNDGFSIEYTWDGEKFNTSKAAIKHGFKLRESDDFNIGVLQHGRLVQFRWMDAEVLDEDLTKIELRTGLAEYCDTCSGTGLMEGWNRRDGYSCPTCGGDAVVETSTD
jgi:hypothetical protein